MASTVTIDAQPDGLGAAGNAYQRYGTINLGTYATGGVAVTAAQFQLDDHIFDLDVRPAGGYLFEFLKATGLVKAYRQRDPAAAGGADIPLPEVTNGVDLSSVSSRFVAVGH